MDSLRTLAAAAALVLVACEIPTEPPAVEQRWILPVEATSMPVGELLPDGVEVVGDAFVVSVDPSATSRTLGSLCAACAALQGLTAPAPPFQGSFSLEQVLPADVVAAVLSGGDLTIAVENGFGYDPLAGGGTLSVVLTDVASGRALANVEIDGATESLATGTTLTRVISLAPGPVGSVLRLDTWVTSPGGPQVTIDTSREVRVSATASKVRLTSADVVVAGTQVTLEGADIDVSDLDSAITERIERGALVLDITNPFGISVSARIDIAYPGGMLSRDVEIGSGPVTTTSLEYTGEEFRLFLGKEDVTLTGSGVVGASAGTATVFPGQDLLIEAEIDLTIVVGG